MVKVKSRPKSKQHSRHTLTQDTINIPGIVIGAAAVCTAGAALAYVLMPKKEPTFSEKLHGITDTIEDYASDAYHSAKDTTSDLCDSACELFSNGHANRNLVLGLIGAGVLGASALYALNQRSSDETGRWGVGKLSETATMVFDTIATKLREGKQHKQHPIQEAIDWATMGLNVWNEIKKGKYHG